MTGRVGVVLAQALALVLVACTAAPVHSVAGSHTRTATSATSTVSSAATSAPTQRGTPTASADDGATATYPIVGALMRDGQHGVHGCTASVVASSTENTVLTAAHCIHGTGADLSFVPEYRRGNAPIGTWRVTGAYVSAQWQRDSDPRYDYAVLTVAPRSVDGRRERLGALTGVEQLGASPARGTEVTVVAYRYGSGDTPISCRAAVYLVQGYPTIDCHGFSAGTSGGPWLTTDADGHLTVVGVIGGRDQGGCHEYTSHTATFTADVAALIGRAEHGSTADAVRRASAPDC